MRFINTTSLQFREVHDSHVLKLKGGYAILSHRWGENEVLYTDVLLSEKTIETKAGYAKFRDSCALAKRLGYDLLWSDTCCINKADATEMGEAINSMYRWYANAKVCIAYLEDVSLVSQISQSAWFSRGWTLQELIAPKKVSFYSKGWALLGDKGSLSSTIVSKTGIPADVLKNSRSPQTCSVAQRMSWAAKRETTRVEDRAYSLMGLFDVNMPMIYGEQEQAFIRLQEGIIARSTDESIFAWDLELLEEKQSFTGLLAPSPACFEKCGNVVNTGRSRGFNINQFGISVSLPATMLTLDTFEATLKVSESDFSTKKNYSIILAKLPHDDLYARVKNTDGKSKVVTEPSMKNVIEFIVSRDPAEAPIRLFPGFLLRKVKFYDPQISRHSVLSRGRTADTDRIVFPDRTIGTTGIILLYLKNHDEANGVGWIKLGFDSSCNPVCFMTFPPHEDDSGHTIGNSFQTAFEEAAQLQPGSQKRIDHPIWSDDWLNATSGELARLENYSYDSRSQQRRGDAVTDLNIVFKAPSFEVFVTIWKRPDVRPDARQSEPTPYVWTVDIRVGDEPQVRHGDSGCCTC